MAQNLIEERKLAELQPARRNRYYYGKLMDVLHCSMEQQYAVGKQWLYNRAVLGAGVACGLDVIPIETDAGSGIVIRSGLAFDRWGREIVVPADVVIVPLSLTDDCGAPLPNDDAPLPTEIAVKLCYSECLTDWSPTTVSVSGCGCGCDCAAGTIVETYCVKIVAGHAPAVDEPCKDEVLQAIKAGELHQVLCALSRECPPDPDDPCLTLANLTVQPPKSRNKGPTLTIDTISPRSVAATNQTLMTLMSCLAECCASHGDGPPPPPSLLHVTGVRVLTTGGDHAPEDPNLPTIGRLAADSDTITVKAQQRPDVVEITFDGSYDPTSVVLGDSFQVIKKFPSDRLLVSAASNVVRVHRKAGFKAGEHRFLLVGDPSPVTKSTRAIRAADGTRLDGEGAGHGLPSGEGTEGGDFKFRLVVRP